MKLSRISVSTAAVAILAGGVALWPANAQPAGGGQPPAGGRPSPRGDRPAGDAPGAGGSEWREKLKDELRDHPRLGRALLALHDAKDYLEKVPGDLGGHKASSIKACDDTIKEATEAIKFDEKRPDPTAGRPGRPGGRGGDGGGKPGDTKPADPAPAPAPAQP